MRGGLTLTSEHLERSRAVVLEELRFAGELLEQCPYLCSDSASIADIAFACMAAPAFLPSREEGFAAHLPQAGETHEDATAFAREVRATPAGRHALRMFAKRPRRT